MLEKYLKKLGLSSYLELNAEEKETYKEWELALSGRKLTDKDVIDWLQFELDTAVSRITEVDLKKEDEIFRKMEIKMIKKIINFINSPKVERQFAEKAIDQLMKN
jgi:hypothetical protein